MRDWYLSKSPRDRLVLMVVGILVLATLLYVVVVHPVRTGVATRTQNVLNARQNLEFMREGQARVRASGGIVNNDILISDKAPYLLIDDIIRKAGIKLPERVEPTGKDGARVQFSEVEFDKLIAVIAELERFGLTVSTLNVSRKDTGMVSARFNMEKG